MFAQSSDIKSVDVFVTLIDGRELYGALTSGLVASIASALNGEGQFVELCDTSGTSVFISKHQIASVEPASAKGKSVPKLQSSALAHSGWHHVLGVAPTASYEQVKQAYYALAKQYHPDLYPESVPQEMRNYASDMFKRINGAFETFQSLQMAA